MNIHELKTDPAVWDAVALGKKTFEIRKDDRHFQVGDVLVLRRTNHSRAEMDQGEPLEYTGPSVNVQVNYILRGPIYGLQEGWVIMSFKKPAGIVQSTEPYAWQK